MTSPITCMQRNEKEMVKKNIELSTEFSRYLFDHPELEEAIPPDAEITIQRFDYSAIPRFDQKGPI